MSSYYEQDDFSKRLRETILSNLKPEYLQKKEIKLDENEKREVIANAIDYSKVEKAAKAHRHEIINSLIGSLIKPLNDEQECKNSYRKRILIGFSIYFALVTIVVFTLLFYLSRDGYDANEVKVIGVLVSGMFVNMLGLVFIIFKYLFDDKNSLLKDMINLVAKTLESDSLKK